ncbi:MAG: MarR family winged helix-turn-helix transcriptional regulator [Oscillospiraceae bacterium]
MEQEINSQYARLISIGHQIDELYHAAAERMGLSDSAFTIMYGLYEAGRPCTQKEICERWGLNKQTVNSSVKKLVEQGVLRAAPSGENFREKLIFFTEKGGSLADRTVAKIMDAERAAFEKFSEEERQAAVALSEKQLRFMREEFSEFIGEIK